MYSLFAAPPRENGQSLKRYNSMLCKVIMFALFVTFLFISGNEAKAQSAVSCNGPDYVFGDDYKLRDLSELELYIKTNKCLPDIPTAEEVTNSGVELGDMQSRMLKKIEELTLYIIELKKENDEIKKIIKSKKE